MPEKYYAIIERYHDPDWVIALLLRWKVNLYTYPSGHVSVNGTYCLTKRNAERWAKRAAKEHSQPPVSYRLDL